MYYQNLYYYLVPLTKEQIESGIVSSYPSVNSPEYRGKTTIDLNKQYELYDPLTGLIYGNMFIKEYRGYKDYKPGIAKPRSEKTQMLLDVMMYGNACHDIVLKLDLYPANKELQEKFTEYNNKYAIAKKSYEDKYGPLDVKDASIDKGEFNWIKVKSSWLERWEYVYI